MPSVVTGQREEVDSSKCKRHFHCHKSSTGGYGKEENCSKRKKTIRKALAKEGTLEVKKKRREPGTLGDVESLVRDEEDGNQMKSWRTAALAVLCYFGCRRLSNVIRVKDVIIEEDKVIVWMKKQKNYELNEGNSFSMVAVGNGEIHSCDGSQEELCFIS